MRTADAAFRLGLDYLIAARRLDTAGHGLEALDTLAAEYRRRANVLMGCADLAVTQPGGFPLPNVQP